MKWGQQLVIGNDWPEISAGLLTVLCIAALVPTSLVDAHHSDSALVMDSVVSFSGTVTEYSIRNPHTYFTVETRDDRGAPIVWTVQMASSLTVSRRGWSNDTLLIGDQVTVGVHPAQDGRSYGLLAFIEGQGGHSGDGERTHEGHSIGWWNGETLVVDTANFADNPSPNQNGIPSGAQKHVVERYRLTGDGTRMSVEFTLKDPEYIVGSMTHTRDLIYSPHLDMSPFNCDLEATRRYLPH